MRPIASAMTAPLLWVPVVAALLSCCHRAPTGSLSSPVTQDEINASIEAGKHHPSLAPGSKEAGPPIHVSPFVPRKPATAMHDNHDMPMQHRP